MLSRPLALAFAVLVGSVWAAYSVAALAWPDRYEFSTELNAIFMFVLGVVYGITPSRARQALSRLRGGTSEDEDVAEELDADPEPPRGDGT
ncbi:hypothetical protein JOF41_007385 [Saccharothrix coeruleofusca]|uniref:hypothetical protein n=1 Tax=Saccharothrix coeruleofusca TaxID=33919 RepID=UPI001AE40EB6|nr:hypothetical protein [Saccharothrix coeruleofusca]MBP2341131.1 hypothetical protein [Saccharothrix coeruleofusca]